MDQSRDRDIAHLHISDLQRRLLLLYNLHLLFGKEGRADAVLKASMHCRRKHLEAKTELLKVL